MIDRKLFYQNIKTTGLFPRLSQSQMNGLEAILSQFEALKMTDTRMLAYMLATAYHETARTMQPIEEYGKGKGRPYGSKIKMDRKPYTTPDKLYYGRGFVQLTWYENYLSAGKKLKIDLLNNPELAMQLPTATAILFKGMQEGWFTGKKLSDYINGPACDFKNARRIINGLDRAADIAGYATSFSHAIVVH